MKKIFSLMLCFFTILTIFQPNLAFGIDTQWWDDAAIENDNPLIKVRKDGLFGFVDQTGNVIVNTYWNNVWSYSENRALFTKYNMFGFLNESGKIVISPDYEYAESFSNGLALVKLNNKYGFINTSGNTVL